MESVINRVVIPEAFMRLPAKINNGTASKLTLWVWEIGSWTIVLIGRSRFCKKNKTPEIPIEKPTGIPIMRKTRNASITRVISVPHCDLPFGQGSFRF
jgi:hypothetical protein